MSKMIALKFDRAGDADHALDILLTQQDTEPTTVCDAVTITWPEGKRRPQTKRPRRMSVVGSAVEAARAVSIGLLYVAVVAGSSALTVLRRIVSAGIEPEFSDHAREQIAEGSSILVVLVDEQTERRLDDLLNELAPEEIGRNSFLHSEAE